MPNSIYYTEDFHQPNSFNTVTFDVGILSNGKRHADPELAAEAEEMFQAVYQLKSDHDDLAERLTKSKIEQLEQKREQLVFQCRAAKREHTALQNRAGLFDQTTRRLNEETNVASMNLRAAKETVLQPAYSTKKDFDDHAEKIASLQLEFDRRFAEYNNHVMLISSYTNSLNDAAEKHNNLLKAELECRQSIARAKGDKSPIIDSETGLQR